MPMTYTGVRAIGFLLVGRGINLPIQYIGVSNGNKMFDPNISELAGDRFLFKKSKIEYITRDQLNTGVRLTAVFGANEANFNWSDWGISAHTTNESLFNRVTTNMGLKIPGQEWTLKVELHFKI